jgi:predicted ATPase
MIVSEVKFKDRIIELCANDVDIESNVFTIIVGRNGCGKSTLLQKICLLGITSLLNKDKNFYRMSDLFEYSERKANTTFDETGCLTLVNGASVQQILIEDPICYPQNLDLSQIPEEHRQSVIDNYRHRVLGQEGKIVTKTIDGIKQEVFNKYPKFIAVSSSPFDKYPVIDNRRSIHGLADHYLYRGARTKNSSNKSYMRAKFDQLGSSFINFFLKPEKSINEILPLFSYVGITTKFKVLLEFPFSISLNELSNNEKDPLSAVNRSKFFKGVADYKNYTDDDTDKIIKSVKALQEGFFTESNRGSFEHHGKTFSFDLDINNIKDNKITDLDEFSILASYDLIDLVDIEFTKQKDDKSFFLTDASSGELCILFNILAIAGTISDDSIILLDEPELSLHPEWQKGFLPLLEEVFSKYKKCHFIIATHSPQIISSIPKSNSYVVNLESNPAKVIAGKKLALHSSDFQLAKLFKSPGFRNEYLTKECVKALSLLSRVDKPKPQEIDSIHSLEEYLPFLDDGDPVKDMIEIIIETLRKVIA